MVSVEQPAFAGGSPTFTDEPVQRKG